MGIRVGLPFEQEVNPFVEQAFEHKTFVPARQVVDIAIGYGRPVIEREQYLNYSILMNYHSL
jgi:hypothetical protein